MLTAVTKGPGVAAGCNYRALGVVGAFLAVILDNEALQGGPQEGGRDFERGFNVERIAGILHLTMHSTFFRAPQLLGVGAERRRTSGVEERW